MIGLKTDWMHLTCDNCGIDFKVTGGLFHVRTVENEDIYCPNGHRCQFEEPRKDGADQVAKLTAENTRLKRELFQAIHDREQAEASGESVDVSERGAKSAPEVISAPKPSCPKCGKIFNRFGGIFRKHLMHDHGLASTKAGELMYEIQKAFDADRLSK